MPLPDSTAPARHPKALKAVLIVSASLLGTLLLTLTLHAVYRRYRRAIWAYWFSFRGIDPNAPENRYPAALPTRQSKRFKGIRVVDGNAILTKRDYDRLRAQTPILIQVDDITASEASEDYSQVEVMTVTTFSRAASIASPRFLNREEREGFGDDDDRMSAIDVDPVEVEMLQMKEDIARDRNIKEFGHICTPDQHAPPTMKSALKPGLKKGMPKRALSQHTLDPSTGVTIVTAMSREDLHAFLASEEINDKKNRKLDKRARIAEMLQVPYSPLLSPGVNRSYHSGAWERSPSERPIDKADPLDGSTTSFLNDACSSNAERPTVAMEYGDLLDNNSVPSRPETRLSATSVAARSEESPESSSMNSASLPALSVRSLRSVRFTLPERERREKRAAPALPKRKKHRRREVRREVHRHHVEKGGYIICKDDDEEVRRKVRNNKSSKSEPTTPKRSGKKDKKGKRRFVFQRRPSDEFYGTAEYLPAPSNE